MEHSPTDEITALRLVVQGTVAETGTEFFRALVRNLAQALGTSGAWVTEYLPAADRLRAHAFWLNGRQVEGYEYDVKGTACAKVIARKKVIHVPDRVIELYPDDPDLAPAKAVSYLGMPLLDTDGSVMGHLAVLDDKPMPRSARLLPLFEIFAARAAAEQRRLRREGEIRTREQQLDALLAGAMDAILVLDAGQCVERVNPAAEKLFGYTAKQLAGARLRDLLDQDSFTHLSRLAGEKGQHPDGPQQLWMPQHLAALRADGTSFPAEATLSGFSSGGRQFHALILRSIDERMEAGRRIQLLLDEQEYLRDSAGIGELLGQSRVMRGLFAALKRVAVTDATVLVTGETGTGKELVARSIHQQSGRRDQPLVRVNCAAIPGTLMESEFFGHERGAFTGATMKRDGRFALADRGTIFLDEVGELPLDLQAKLLRVLQEGEFEPLGSTRTCKVNVRIVAATNRDLAGMVKEGRFREDLYYRLNVFPLPVPPLRERGDDVVVLARAILDRLARRMGRRFDPLHPDDVRRLREYPWPGNVRELQNVIERAIILSPGTRLELQRTMPVTVSDPARAVSGADGDARILTSEELTALEKANIERALRASNGKISGPGGAAWRLGLAASTLSSRIKTLGIGRSG